MKFERYTFAAILLILAAIIILVMLELPSETSEQVSGIVVKSPETTTVENTTYASANNGTKIINLNTATLEELDTLQGIGESRARSIIAYREHLGGYTSIEQIKDISGISDTIFDNIKDQITV